MLRCTSPFVIAAYAKVRLIPQGSRALPAAFLRIRLLFMTYKTFYVVSTFLKIFIHPGTWEQIRRKIVFSSHGPSPASREITICLDIFRAIQ